MTVHSDGNATVATMRDALAASMRRFLQSLWLRGRRAVRRPGAPDRGAVADAVAAAARARPAATSAADGAPAPAPSIRSTRRRPTAWPTS